MKLFIVTYDRKTATLVDMQEYDVSERDRAEGVRFQKELSLAKYAPQFEVVLLESLDRRTLMRTHQRYFTTIQKIAGRVSRLTDSDTPGRNRGAAAPNK